MKTSIHHSEEICKRLEAKKMTETISPYAMESINTIMLAIFRTGYHGKTVDMEKCSDKHRTSISRFLHNDQWNASSLEKAMKELVIHTIYEEADCKMKLAVDKYQIRSANGIKHFWLIASLAYMIACFESKRYNFSEGYHLLSQTIRREQISFIFDYAQNGGDKSALLHKIA